VANQFVAQRLVGIQQTLIGVHRSGVSMTAASKGEEREAFIKNFLRDVLPPPYRFGTGEATDVSGNLSGQLDVVVEHPFSPTLPAVGGKTRLYLAESVAAVIEVKSDVATQWKEAVNTANQLAPLQRQFGAMMAFGGSGPSPNIPLFVVGYTGWKTTETADQNLQKHPNIAGVLVIESGIFVSSPRFQSLQTSGPWGLWGLITCLHWITNSLQAASTNPLQYCDVIHR
jgi:hypothetical protein